MRDRAQFARLAMRSNLMESPVTVLREQYELSLDDAARLLGISVLQLVRLEAATRRLRPTAFLHFVSLLQDAAPCQQPATKPAIDMIGVPAHG